MGDIGPDIGPDMGDIGPGIRPDIGPDIGPDMGDIGPDIGPDMGDIVPGSPCAFLQNAEPPQSPTGDKSTQPGSTSSRNFCVWGSNCLTQIGKIAMCQITLHRPISKIAMRTPQHRRATMFIFHLHTQVCIAILLIDVCAELVQCSCAHCYFAD